MLHRLNISSLALILALTVPIFACTEQDPAEEASIVSVHTIEASVSTCDGEAEDFLVTVYLSNQGELEQEAQLVSVDLVDPNAVFSGSVSFETSRNTLHASAPIPYFCSFGLNYTAQNGMDAARRGDTISVIVTYTVDGVEHQSTGDAKIDLWEDEGACPGPQNPGQCF